MQIGPAGIVKISEMICGDEPFSFFPYRSSSYLSKFFQELDLDYTHDGTTRRVWVKSVLDELNSQSSGSEFMPSLELTKVIEYLVHPNHFANNQEHDKAIEALDYVVRPYKLTVKKDDATNLVHLRTANQDYVSSIPKLEHEKTITFKPQVFEVPDKALQDRLVSVMTPFDTSFDGTLSAVKKACNEVSLTCIRADDIWINSAFIQDIFELIYCSKIVIVDFSGRNPNVMYEMGIAHTLGKIVIPVTQSIDDIPADIQHHRALKYLPNSQGYDDLEKQLTSRLKTLNKS